MTLIFLLRVRTWIMGSGWFSRNTFPSHGSPRNSTSITAQTSLARSSSYSEGAARVNPYGLELNLAGPLNAVPRAISGKRGLRSHPRRHGPLRQAIRLLHHQDAGRSLGIDRARPATTFDDGALTSCDKMGRIKGGWERAGLEAAPSGSRKPRRRPIRSYWPRLMRRSPLAV